MAKNFKVFAKQAGIKARDVNEYLMTQAVVQVTSTADLDTALVKAGVRVAYVTGTNALYYWNGTAWTNTKQETVNAGMGFGASQYLTTDYVGSASAASLSAGTYFVPVMFHGITEVSHIDIYVVTGAPGTTQYFQVQLYSSQYGKPKTPIGNTVSLTFATIDGNSAPYMRQIGYGGPDYVLKPGLYFIAFTLVSPLKANTYQCVVRSATSGGPNYFGSGGTFGNLGLRNYPGYYTSTQYGTGAGLTTFPVSPSVTEASTVPLIRIQVNTTSSIPVNIESGLYA